MRLPFLTAFAVAAGLPVAVAADAPAVPAAPRAGQDGPGARAEGPGERGAAEPGGDATAEGEPATATGASEPNTVELLRAARAQLEALALEYQPDADPIATGVRRTRPSESLPAVLTSEVPSRASARAEGVPPEWLAGLALPDFPVRWDDHLVQTLEYYRTDPRGRAHMRGWLERAGLYADTIDRALREAGLPGDLLYVAMVESGFDPNAVSQADAIGIWQFTSSTARDYGLTEDRWLDERRSPERSTEAAMRFFRDLHAELDSWPLAFAAFNMGHTALLRALRKYNTNDFWVLSRLEAGLPYETIAYVNKIIACAIVGRNLDRFGFADVKRMPAPGVERVVVPGGTSLGRIAQAAAMPVDDLAALNPEFRRRRVPPDVRDWTVRIPRERLARFQKAWPAAVAVVVSHAEHVLRFGERLQDVAEMYGTSVDKLRRLNDLAPEEAVKPGARLSVPDVEPSTPVSEETPVVVGVPARGFAYRDRRRVFYRVTGDDTLGGIAAFFHVGVDEVRRWNDVSADAALPRGLVLQLFVPKGVDLSRAVVLPPESVRPLVVGSEEFLDYHEAKQGRTRVRYRVKEGDTLAKLADRFGLSAGSIARINGFSTATRLEPDREIVVYVEKESPAPAAEPRSRRRAPIATPKSSRNTVKEP